MFRTVAKLSQAEFEAEWAKLRLTKGQKLAFGLSQIYWHRDYNYGGWWTWIQWLEHVFRLPDYPPETQDLQVYLRVLADGATARYPRAHWDHDAYAGGQEKPWRWVTLKGWSSVGPKGLYRVRLAPIVSCPVEVPSGVWHRLRVQINGYRYWTP